MKEKINPINSFVAGARKGFSMSMNNMLPNVLFAFAMIQILNLSGLSNLIGKVCGPLMGIFGLPGIAATAVIAGILSSGGGLGATASLALSGQITNSDATILLVGICLFWRSNPIYGTSSRNCRCGKQTLSCVICSKYRNRAFSNVRN